MDDLDKYIQKRKERDPEFAKGYESGFQEFLIGALLKEAREDAGVTQEELATAIHTKKSVISRLENHASDARVSTLRKVAQALGKELVIELREPAGKPQRRNSPRKHLAPA
ncbi:MAG: helix-turn-helix transcriptional regulator [Opitutales bacterium]|nr:helix-turn-helix transcriptional regulator [Opitutales bacterium]